VAAKPSESKLPPTHRSSRSTQPQTSSRSRKRTELATYDPRRLTGVSVYQEIEREFSVGDRIQFTAPDKSLGVANRDLAAIEAIHPDGRLSVRLDNNRQIEFNPNEHRHLDHGYAVTSHSSQGLTAERVLVHADTSVHPDLLNSRFAYVSISRASHEATLFTDDMAKLGPQLGADVSKTSALEINQASSIAQGIGVFDETIERHRTSRPEASSKQAVMRWGFCEPTAAYVWRGMADRPGLSKKIVLWNLFGFHPHEDYEHID
jgi:hypothetical protein